MEEGTSIRGDKKAGGCPNSYLNSEWLVFMALLRGKKVQMEPMSSRDGQNWIMSRRRFRNYWILETKRSKSW